MESGVATPLSIYTKGGATYRVRMRVTKEKRSGLRCCRATRRRKSVVGVVNQHRIGSPEVRESNKPGD